MDTQKTYTIADAQRDLKNTQAQKRIEQVRWERVTQGHYVAIVEKANIQIFSTCKGWYWVIRRLDNTNLAEGRGMRTLRLAKQTALEVADKYGFLA